MMHTTYMLHARLAGLEYIIRAIHNLMIARLAGAFRAATEHDADGQLLLLVLADAEPLHSTKNGSRMSSLPRAT
jgi:hypothetical protein